MEDLVSRPTAGWLRIKEFMEKVPQDTPTKPVIPYIETRKLRAKLILEEALETIEKGLGLEVYQRHGRMSYRVHRNIEFSFSEGVQTPDLVEIVDGCEDLRVVTTGTLIACGVRDGDISLEVDRNNLAKFGPGGYRRDDGKWIKPPGHKPPDIESLLIKQGWTPPI